MKTNKPEIGDKRKVFCNTCKGETHHKLLASQLSRYYEQEEARPSPQVVYWEDHDYRLWGCLGCDACTMEIAYTGAGMINQDGSQFWDSSFHPQRQSQELPMKRFQMLDKKLSSIYREIIVSYNYRLRILCAVGLRSLLEGVCAEKGITKGRIEKKIDQLDQFLPSNIVSSLHSFRFMGNLAAHELLPPTNKELGLAIEVMEDILNFLYELDYKASKLPPKIDL